MAYKGNQGTEAFVSALCKIADTQYPKEQQVDSGQIRSDYSLVMDSYPAPIPRGEWSVAKSTVLMEDGRKGTASPEIKAGARVAVVWVGNEAVVIGNLSKA